jgi:signal transduction histidine kinase/CheY-like chemotaxis protein
MAGERNVEHNQADPMVSATETIAQTAASRAPQPLRVHLFMLAASGLLPLVIAAVLSTAYLIHDRRQAAQRSALELSRALATAVDSELKSTIDVLQSLALSDHLAASRLAQFQDQAKRVARQRGWRRILLTDARGEVVMSSNQALGEAIPPPMETASLQLVSFSRAPVIGPVRESRSVLGNALAVRVPVLKDGQLVNVLSALLDTGHILSVLTRQNVPETWVAAVFDHEGARIARTKFNATARPAPSLQAMLDTGAAEGMGATYTLEGVPSFSGFSRLKDSGWTVAVSISAREVHLALLPLLLALGAGLLASLGLSAYLAWVYAHRVSQPIHTLKNAAAALVRGHGVALPDLGITELDEVSTALNRASADREAALAERQQSDAERERLLTRVTEALRSAEEAGRIKDEFLAVLGHELRNPLAPISTALHLMQLKGDERTRREREILQRQLSYMVRLVDDLLDVSRITNKRFTIQLEPLRLATVVVEPVIASLRPLLGARALQVRIAADAAGAWVRGDEVRLVQALNNVLGNAVKFTAPEGLIEVAMFVRADNVHIEVHDDGVGMPLEVLERAFDVFFQAPQAMDRGPGGLGLGLAIVKSVMDMHNGSVRAFSRGPGHGTTVVLSLPWVDPPTLHPAAPEPDARPGKGKVLVVDDNQDAADTTAALLEIVGYEVRVAYHAVAALELLSSFTPDAAVLDIGLPGMSGYELAAALRRAPHHFTGLLIALTGYGEQEDVACAMKNGFDAHLTKPIQAQALLDLLATRIGTQDLGAISLS